MCKLGFIQCCTSIIPTEITDTGQGQALLSHNKQHWQYFGITIPSMMTVWWMLVSTEKQAFTDVHVHFSLNKGHWQPSVLAALSHLCWGLLTAWAKLLSTSISNMLSYKHMFAISGCNFTSRSCWDKRHSPAWEKFKKIRQWLNFFRVLRFGKIRLRSQMMNHSQNYLHWHP